MSPSVGNVYFDTCTLSNFATVQRLDLLDVRYGYRARWTETVQHEVRRGVSVEPKLQKVLDAEWLGDPVVVDGDPAALREIDIIRRALGGSSEDPLEHLGEAEILYHLYKREPTGIFVTDDGPAYDFAKNRGTFVLNSQNVLAECFQYGEIGCPNAYNLLLEMRQQDRGVFVPDSHLAVCPT